MTNFRPILLVKGILHPRSFFAHPAYQKVSTLNRHPGMLVDVYPRLLGQKVACLNLGLIPNSRMNNPHRNES